MSNDTTENKNKICVLNDRIAINKRLSAYIGVIVKIVWYVWLK